VWKVWGVPQAINAGDGMFTLAFAAMQRLRWRNVSNSTILNALDTFTHTCLALTEGQHLDMGFERRDDVTVPEYMRMIVGKTAALVGASVSIGARIGGANEPQCAALQHFGQAVGMAFQIRDDILGIWGDPQITGKPAGNDILRRKKSYPLLYALNHPRLGEQLETLFGDHFDADKLPQALDLLAESGALQEAERAAQEQHDVSIMALQQALGEGATSSALWSLADSLLRRAA
jgi:geranylgeranyl diphosphate synthase type I